MPVIPEYGRRVVGQASIDIISTIGCKEVATRLEVERSFQRRCDPSALWRKSCMILEGCVKNRRLLALNQGQNKGAITLSGVRLCYGTS